MLRIAAAALLAWGAWMLWRGVDPVEEIEAAVDTILPESLSMWNVEKIPLQYRDAVMAAEARYGLPAGMLGRLLWQESRYREDIITGRTKSSAGALGIAQFMPATAREMGIDPLDAFASIDAAGRYLGRLFASLGSWDKALAAYNWGIGNVRSKGLDAAPAETRKYFSQILADLGLGSAYA